MYIVNNVIKNVLISILKFLAAFNIECDFAKVVKVYSCFYVYLVYLIVNIKNLLFINSELYEDVE